jgi:hypothetical protein
LTGREREWPRKNAKNAKKSGWGFVAFATVERIVVAKWISVLYSEVLTLFLVGRLGHKKTQKAQN